jgi:MFS family permease
VLLRRWGEGAEVVVRLCGVVRSLVGVGEAAYVVIATPMIADFFPSKERNVALGIFFLAIPVGAAIGPSR